MMLLNIYFVRVKHNRVSVGMFACRPKELVDMVDEWVDPEMCEYRLIGPGGFKFGGEVDLSADTDNDDTQTSPEFDNTFITGGWIDAVRAPDDDGSFEAWQDVYPRDAQVAA